MMIKRLSLMFLLGAILAWGVLGVAVGPALAVPPDRMAVPYNVSYQVADCGDFQVINYEESTLQLTFFYDQAGELVRVNQLWSGTDTLTNSETGASIQSNFTNHAVFDLTEMVVHQSGVFWHAIVPHAGQIFFEAGRYIGIDFDQPDAEIFFTGVSTRDPEPICSALR